MSGGKVLARRVRPGEMSCRDAFADGLALVQGSRTDADAADALGWSTGTVRNVRNRTNSLSAKLISDALFSAGAAFIAPFLALHGFRIVPLSAADGDDHAFLRHARLGAKLAEALDDGEITAAEARGMVAEMDALQQHMDRLRVLAGVSA